MTQDLQQPKVSIDGSVIPIATFEFSENCLRPISLLVEISPTNDCQTWIGKKMEVDFLGQRYSLIVQNCERYSTPFGQLHRISASQDQALWSPSSRSMLKQSRTAAIKRVLALTSNIDSDGKQLSDVVRDVLTLFRENPWILASRLALQGGQILLNHASGPRLRNPGQPGKIMDAPATCLWSQTMSVPTSFTLVGRAERSWGKTISKSWSTPATAAAKLQIPWPEAIEVRELQAVGDAIKCLEKAGNWTVNGGTELQSIGPGDWLRVAGMQPFLVAERNSSWNAHDGWQIKVSSEYPWIELAKRANYGMEPAVVVGYDPQLRLLKVELPHQEKLNVYPAIRADRCGQKGQKFTVPEVGEVGAVVFGHGPDQGLYIGASLVGSQLSAEDFDRLFDIAKTANFSESRFLDGRWEGRWKSVSWKLTDAATFVAKLFKFFKA